MLQLPDDCPINQGAQVGDLKAPDEPKVMEKRSRRSVKRRASYGRNKRPEGVRKTG